MDLLGSFMQYLFMDGLPHMPGIRAGCLESCQARPIYLVDSIPANHIFLGKRQEIALQGILKKLNHS